MAPHQSDADAPQDDPSASLPTPSRGFRFVAAIVMGLVRLMGWKVQVRGVEHVPGDRGAVIAYNHHSYVDFVMAAWVLYRQLGRSLAFLAKRELFDSPWTGWGVRLAGAVPVDRARGVERHKALEAAVAAARAGHLVMVAPEQTISQSFELLPFKTGAVRTAQAAGVPVVPCVGWGTHRAATKGVKPRLARRIPVVVEYLEPIEIGPDADPVTATEHIQQVMSAHLHRVQEAYPDRPADAADAWWVPARLGGTAPSHEAVLAEHLARQDRWGPHPGHREAS